MIETVDIMLIYKLEKYLDKNKYARYFRKKAKKLIKLLKERQEHPEHFILDMADRNNKIDDLKFIIQVYINNNWHLKHKKI